MARRLGWSEGDLDRARHGDYDAFPARERAALRYAARVTRDARAVGEDLWTELRAQFDEAQIVELTCVVALFAYANRWNDALQVDVTR